MTIFSPSQAHQVFLNYRGEQLRYSFVSHLIDAFERNEINFFVDKYEQRGKDLKNLFVRIQESRIALAIFSTRYTESSWCMDELVKMKKLADKRKLHVIPIFYKVKAGDVRNQTGEFGDNFWTLAKVSSGDQIKKWKDALECISNKMGLSFGDNSSEADFVKEVVKAVQRVVAELDLRKKRFISKRIRERIANEIAHIRGEELRYSFVSHLIDAFQRNEVNFFVDKYEQRGKDLNNLFVRIQESRIALAIFSTRYGESRWPMDELVKMKKLVDQGKLAVIPIFYKVEAEHVKEQKGEFGDNFWTLAKASSGDQIKKLKEALECISGKMGLSLGDKSSEADFVKEIVKEVQRVIAAIGFAEKENNFGKRTRKDRKCKCIIGLPVFKKSKTKEL